jgi:hypothetical protein
VESILLFVPFPSVMITLWHGVYEGPIGSREGWEMDTYQWKLVWKLYSLLGYKPPDNILEKFLSYCLFQGFR